MSLTRRTLIQSAVLGTAALASVTQAKPKTAIPPQNPSLGIFDPKTSKEPPWFLFSCSLQV